MASSRTEHRASELQSWPYCVFTIKSVHSASLFVYQLAMVGIKAQICNKVLPRGEFSVTTRYSYFFPPASGELNRRAIPFWRAIPFSARGEPQ